MSPEGRHSDVAYIVVCLRVGGTPHFLLGRHKKWGDWSLLGGHVEPFEHGSWAAAAARETQEELPPLRHRKDFVLVPIFSNPVAWGPDASRSADDRPTTYQAQFFAMEFLAEPAAVFARLDVHDLRLVPQGSVERDTGMAKPLRILEARLGGGLTSVPLAWSSPVDRAKLPSELFAPGAT
jgi:hypothetical protein